MLKDKEAEGEEVTKDLRGRGRKGEKKRKDVCSGNYIVSWMVNKDFDSGPAACLRGSQKLKLRRMLDLNCDKFSYSDTKMDGSMDVEPQDADYSIVPTLSNELEISILARVPRSEHWKLYLLNKQFFHLLKSGELFKIRRQIGFKESSVLMLPMGDNRWWAFDRQFSSCRKLPEIPSDGCFTQSDKESVCAGSHLIVSGREIGGFVLWRFEMETNKWFKGPSMRSPRCLFASATCGTYAFVAGGTTETGMEVLNSAEKYNPETKSWELLPRMHQRRKLCSGCYMDNKFYVIGGKNEEGKDLSCGEAYDKETNTWQSIENMLKDAPVATFQSPPLVAVVNNELYSLETWSNELRVYLKSTNTWKKLGSVPVRADVNRGWGVAFKSLGNELLVIGASPISGDSMSIYTCCPPADAGELQWRRIGNCCRSQLNHFILNCSVMVA